MKIAQIPRRFVQSHWGGTETVVIETSKRLLAMGHETEILCPAALSTVSTELIQGVVVRRFPYFYPYLGLSDDARRQMDFKGGNLFSPALGLALARMPDLDLIHLHTGRRLGGIARVVAGARKIPYVISLHGGGYVAPSDETRSYTEPTKGAFEWGKLLGLAVGSRRVLDDAAAIVVLGRQEEAEVRRLHPKTNVVYLPNGVDPKGFALGDGAGFRRRLGLASTDEIVLVMGRMDPQKNQMLAVRALTRLAARRPHLHLVFAGPVTNESYADDLLREVKATGLDNRVIVAGGLSLSEVVDAYHGSDLMVLPSIHEPFGIVVLEAWAAGLPVVATRVGGLVDLIEHGRDALLVASGDEAGLADAIEETLVDRTSAMARAKAGRRRAVTEFSWDVVTQRLVDLYEDVSRPRGRS